MGMHDVGYPLRRLGGRRVANPEPTFDRTSCSANSPALSRPQIKGSRQGRENCRGQDALAPRNALSGVFGGPMNLASILG